MFSAWVIYLLWTKNFLGKLIVPILIFFLTLSGIIDLFPIKNDSMYTIIDAPKNQDILWIKENTPPDSVFLNSSYLYHPASLAGRKIFLGWPYFAWSAGYDTTKRDKERKRILGASTLNKDFVCDFLTTNKIHFVSLDSKEKGILLNYSFWETNFPKVYENKESSLFIYDVRRSCR